MTLTLNVRAVAALALALAAAPPPAAAETPAAPLSPDAVKSIVRELIRAEPELVLEALRTLEARQEAAQEAAARQALSTRRAELAGGPFAPVVGNPAGDVTITLFSDYRCGYCKRLDAELWSAVAADGKVRVVVKELPILGPESVEAAKIALAAHGLDPKRYAKLHRGLMAHRGQLDGATALTIATREGYDRAALERGARGAEIAGALEGNVALARALGIGGTPALVIGDRLIPGAIGAPQLAEAIKAARGG